MRKLALSLALLLAACASPPAPKDTFHRLEVAEPAAAGRVALPGVLEVDRFDTDGVLSERAIAYAEAGGIGRYRYDFWNDSPGQMLQDRLAQYLRGAGAAQRVVTPDLRVPPDWVLRGKVRRLEQVPDSDRVRVEMQLGVVGARDGSLVLLENYAAEAPTSGDDVRSAVVAFGRAVSEIFARFAADLARADVAPPRR